LRRRRAVVELRVRGIPLLRNRQRDDLGATAAGKRYRGGRCVLGQRRSVCGHKYFAKHGGFLAELIARPGSEISL
jgi:hypothetical protein